MITLVRGSYQRLLRIDHECNNVKTLKERLVVSRLNLDEFFSLERNLGSQ